MFGALSGGFVSGLAEFGTGLVAMGIWLHALPPVVAASIVVICSVVSQVQTIPTVWHAIQPSRVLPFVLPGLIGVPIGTQLLSCLDPNTFRFGMGIFLLCFSAFPCSVEPA
nr:sulfite exporter TauE/SafE family protein [Limobrevibacterium gyesilva]